MIFLPAVSAAEEDHGFVELGLLLSELLVNFFFDPRLEIIVDLEKLFECQILRDEGLNNGRVLNPVRIIEGNPCHLAVDADTTLL